MLSPLSANLVDRVTLSVTEFMNITGLCRSVTYDMVKRGDLKAIRVGKKMLITKASVDEFLGKERAYDGRR